MLWGASLRCDPVDDTGGVERHYGGPQLGVGPGVQPRRALGSQRSVGHLYNAPAAFVQEEYLLAQWFKAIAGSARVDANDQYGTGPSQARPKLAATAMERLAHLRRALRLWAEHYNCSADCTASTPCALPELDAIFAEHRCGGSWSD